MTTRHHVQKRKTELPFSPNILFGGARNLKLGGGNVGAKAGAQAEGNKNWCADQI